MEDKSGLPTSPSEELVDNPLIGDQKASALKKFLSLLTIPLIVIIVAMYLIPSFIDWDAQRSALVGHIEDVTGRKASVDGEISFSAFPSPSFTVESVKIGNPEGAATDYMVQIDKATASTSLMSLVLGRVNIHSIELDNAIIDLESLDGSSPNWNLQGSRSIEDINEGKNQAGQYFNIDSIKIRSAKLSLKSGTLENLEERIMPLEEITIEAGSLSGPFVINGALKSNITNLDAGFGLQADNLSDSDPADFSFNLYSGSSSLSLEGTIRDWTTLPYVEGKMMGEVDQSLQSLSDYFGIDESILPTTVSAMLSSDTTHIEGDFFASAKGAEVKNVIIDSTSTKGSGSVAITFDKVNQVEISLAFENIDLDKMFADEEALKNTMEDAQRRNEQRIINDFSSSKVARKKEEFDLSTNLKLVLDISAAKVTYKKHEFSGLNVKADVGAGETVIHSFVAKNLPGNTHVNISGSAEEGQAARLSGNKFHSDIKAGGDSLYELLAWLGIELNGVHIEKLDTFEIDGNAEFSSESVAVKKIKMKAGDLSAVGQVLVKYNEDEMPVVNSAFKIQKLDLDKYLQKTIVPAGEDADEFQEIQDEGRFDKLRNLNLHFKKIGSKLIVDEVVFDEKSYNNVSTVIMLEPGILSIKNFKVVDGDSGEVSGSMLVNAKDLRPKIKLEIEADRFSLGEAAVDKSQMPKFNDEEFSFKRLGVADTEFSLKIKDLSLARFKIKDVGLSGKVDKDAIDFKIFRGQIEGGKLDFKAVVGVKRPSASVSFSIASADMSEMARDWFGIKNLTKGKVSTSGTLSTSGLTIKSWVENLEGAGTFTSRGIELKGFSLLALSNKVDTFNSIDKLRLFTSKALTVGKTTVDYLAGNFFIDRGVAEFDRLSMTQSLIRDGVMNAQVDIPGWKMNVDAAMNMKVYYKGSSYRGEAIPMTVNMSGPISDLNAKWDTKGIEAHWERKFYNAN